MESRMAFQVIDNYLEKEEFIKIKDMFFSKDFPWYFNEKIVDYSGNKTKKIDIFNFQFTHIFYNKHNINSNLFNSILPIIYKIKPKALIRIKSNLNVASKKLIKCEEHKDQDFPCKGAIFYINTNNGYTFFKDKKVESKENRIVFFNANALHGGTYCTNKARRMLIYFNYL